MQKIEQLFAWVMADKDENDEGIPAFETPSGWMPMVGADMARAESLRPMAIAVGRAKGKPVKLVRSTGFEVVEVVQPWGSPDCPKCRGLIIGPCDECGRP